MTAETADAVLPVQRASNVRTLRFAETIAIPVITAELSTLSDDDDDDWRAKV